MEPTEQFWTTSNNKPESLIDSLKKLEEQDLPSQLLNINYEHHQDLKMYPSPKVGLIEYL